MAETGSRALARLAEQAWEETMRESPEYATMLGDHRYDDRLSDDSDEARERSLARARERLARLDALSEEELDDEDRITRDVMRRGARLELDGAAHEFHLWNVDQMSGPQVGFVGLVRNFHPRRSAADVESLTKRYAAFRDRMEDYLGHLRAGARAGKTAPRLVVDRVLGQLDGLLDGESFFAEAVADDFAQALGEAAEPGALAALREAAESSVRPAFEAMRATLRELRADCREEPGLWALPGGDEAYAYLVERHLTKAMDPQEVHEIGRRELESIEAEMEAIAAGEGLDRKGYIAKLRADPASYHRDREALLEEFRAAVARGEAALPQCFGARPTESCEVRPIEPWREKDAPIGYYYRGAEDGSRPGRFYANCYKVETRLRANIEALTYHEAVPGHHLQLSIAQQLELPDVRRHGHFTAYIEGWALYAERLSDELGLYTSDAARFGMLGYQARRAARLIVDTGLHALRWPRERAIAFLEEHTLLSEVEVANEVDRYFVLPGQALAYKIGELEIRGLRAELERDLGPAFELTAFHDRLLASGALPLTTLRDVMQRWGAARRAAEEG